MVKSLPTNERTTEDTGLIPGLGRSSGGGHGNPLQYSCLENSHGQKSLVGYSPWGHKKSDPTEASEHEVIPITPILQMEKLRPREVKKLAESPELGVIKLDCTLSVSQALAA